MKAEQLRAMAQEDLHKRLDELAAEGMKLRFQQATMQLANPARVKQVRREIARIKTILADKSREGAK